VSANALEAIAAIVERGDDADTILRETAEALTSEPGVTWTGIAFLEEGELQLGPSAGEPDESRRVRATVSYEGERVGELLVDGEIEADVLAGVAELMAPYVLIGWDTGGEPWEP
jgi:putative methionine-R-sulfoxide reductase with GAF domain